MKKILRVAVVSLLLFVGACASVAKRDMAAGGSIQKQEDVSPAIWAYEKKLVRSKNVQVFSANAGPVYTAPDPAFPDAGRVALGGLDPCGLLFRWQQSDQSRPLFALPSDKGTPEFQYTVPFGNGREATFFAKDHAGQVVCEIALEQGVLILAYGGYSAADIEFVDPKGEDTPHLSDPHNMVFTFERVTTPEGPAWVLVANHYTKAFVKGTSADEEAALEFIERLAAGTIRNPDHRGSGMPVFVGEQLKALPLRRGYVWRPTGTGNYVQ